MGVLAALLMGLSAGAAAAPKKKPPAKKPSTASFAKKAAFSDEAVRVAIEKGKKFVWSQQKPDGSWAGFGGGHKYPAGPTALACYALLASGVAPHEPRMEKALTWLASQRCTKTYTLAMRCSAWLLANKQTGNKYMDLLRKDVSQLIRSTQDGSYGYESAGGGMSTGDNSNAQYGVLGVWAGQLATGEVPLAYWSKVMRHWQACQHADGAWCYNHRAVKGKKPNPARTAPRATMTAAGLATLFVCFDNLKSAQFVRCNVSTDFPPIKKGLDWMDRNFVAALRQGKYFPAGDKHLSYFLYGVERVGLAAGYKYFGTADWYKLGAETLLARQAANGSFVPGGGFGGVIDTSFTLLFLVRGQHPVAFNKLEFSGDWNNRPRDLAWLTRWMSDAYERTMNWQIVNLRTAPTQWHDAPILYLSGSIAPKFSDADLAKLRTYVHQGGTIFSVTECGGSGFREGIRAAYKRLLPQYTLQQLPLDHDLYGIQHRLPGDLALHEISNGVRPLVIHTDMDLPRSWQMNQWRTSAGSFQAAANVLMYVTDRGQLRNRGVSHWPASVPAPPGEPIRIARVKYDGAWDPEPLAYERFRILMARDAKINVRAEEVEIGRLGGSGATIATMTGTERLTLSESARQSLKKYVESGGTLVIDAAGGSREFHESALTVLRDLFGGTSVRGLTGSAPLLRLAGNAIERVAYRRRARIERGLSSTPNLRGVLVNGRAAVIYSPEDITGGLVGNPSYTCVGYAPESCYELMRNAVLLAAR